MNQTWTIKSGLVAGATMPFHSACNIPSSIPLLLAALQYLCCCFLSMILTGVFDIINIYSVVFKITTN